MTRAPANALRYADDHPVRAQLAITFGLYVGLRAWGLATDRTILLGRLDGDARVNAYEQIVGPSTALLGVALTVLAILLALPDRPAVEDLRSGPAWPRLQGCLIFTAAMCLLALVAAFVGVTTDRTGGGHEWLQLTVVTAAAMGVLSIVFAGLVFTMFLQRATEPPDPSRGRGDLGGG